MKSQAYVVGFMMAVAAVFGAGVTGIHLASLDTLEANSAYLRERAVVDVLDLGDLNTLTKEQVAAVIRARVDQSETGRDPQTGWEFDLIKAYSGEGRAAGELIAYAFRFRGMGVWGPIEGILAVTPDLQRTLGLTIVEHSETPGLGGRVEEPVFVDQFKDGDGILVAPSADGTIVAVSSERAGERNVDGITGATQTSLAMGRILNEHLAAFHRAMAARNTRAPQDG